MTRLPRAARRVFLSLAHLSSASHSHLSLKTGALHAYMLLLHARQRCDSSRWGDSAPVRAAALVGFVNFALAAFLTPESLPVTL